MSAKTKVILEYLEGVKARSMFVRIEPYFMLAEIMPRMVFSGNVTADIRTVKSTVSNTRVGIVAATDNILNVPANISNSMADDGGNSSTGVGSNQQYQTKNITVSEVSVMKYYP